MDHGRTPDIAEGGEVHEGGIVEVFGVEIKSSTMTAWPEKLAGYVSAGVVGSLGNDNVLGLHSPDTLGFGTGMHCPTCKELVKTVERRSRS